MRHELFEADDGTVLSAQIGDEIDLILHEMPSGGYRWLVDDVPAELIEPLEQSFDFAEGRVGGRNDTHFLFLVKAVGRGVVRLRYARSWEAGEPALRSYQFTIEAS